MKRGTASSSPEASTGYHPEHGVSLRGFLFWVSAFAVLALANWQIGNLFGQADAKAIFNLCASAVFMTAGIRGVLDPLRDREDTTAEEQRKARLWSLALLILFTVIGTVAAYDLIRPE